MDEITDSDSGVNLGWMLSSTESQMIGPYTVIERLGEGAMGEVYRVRDDSGGEFALKLIFPTTKADAAVRAVREIEVLRSLKDLNIVSLFDTGAADGRTYFTMEYIDGMPLSALMKQNSRANGPITVKDFMAPLGDEKQLQTGPLSDLPNDAQGYLVAIRIVKQIARALRYLHSHEIVHRDIKPSNILIDKSGRAVLTDFGIARVSNTAGGDITASGIFIGTRRYAAPEQHRCERATPAADIYGLGAVLYELVTGKVIFEQITQPGKLTNAIQLENPIDPSKLAPEIPEELNMIIRKCLAKMPQHRFANALELERALQSVVVREVRRTATIGGFMKSVWSRLTGDSASAERKQ